MSRDDPLLTQSQVDTLAKKGSYVPAWKVRSLAQEVQRHREYLAEMAAKAEADTLAE